MGGPLRGGDPAGGGHPLNFVHTPLAGVFRIEPELHTDERGAFARTWCVKEFAEQGLPTDLAQCNVSYNRRRGTLRGLHWQAPPHAEAKLVRCTAGSIFDVVVDLRAGSPTYRGWHAVILTARNRSALFIPEGLAHGFLTLADDTEVFYQMSVCYHPESARGARWDDPAFGIEWPEEPAVISERDRGFPDFAA